jgi:trk system potassium uptake protein TrkH
MARKSKLEYGEAAKWELPMGRTMSLGQRVSPAQLFVSSFALLVIFGTLGFRFLPGLHTGERLSWLDAIFTSTSAICVTGLIVVDTAKHFTFWGQAFLLLLIQVGGLGVLTLTSMLIVSLGRRLSLRQEALYQAPTQTAQVFDPRRLVFDVVRFTFIIEAFGAVVLYVLSLSLIEYQTSPGILIVIAILIIAGGIGFLTMEEFFLRYYAGKRNQVFKVSLHSRIVLVTTAVLLLGGWVLFALFEWEETLADLPVLHKLTNALFLSVTCRTAGFNNIDYAVATDSTNFLSILLMMIGGSPGSTAGGIKTTTFALIGILAWSRYMGHSTPVIGSRSIRDETMQRAVGLFVVAVGVVTVAIFILTFSERNNLMERSFLSKVFEVVSAFNTVGLSMGGTAELTPVGKWTAILLMFFGRVGTLTLAEALMLRRTAPAEFRYAYEDVVIG